MTNNALRKVRLARSDLSRVALICDNKPRGRETIDSPGAKWTQDKQSAKIERVEILWK